MVGVGTTREEGLRRANLAADYVRTSPVVAEPFTNPPGYNSLSANVAMLKAGGKRGGFVRDRHGNPVEQTTASIEQLIESGTCFAGTPDDVYDQIKALSDSVGGFGNLLMFGQGRFLDHKDTVENITLFAKEVLPRLRGRHTQWLRGDLNGFAGDSRSLIGSFRCVAQDQFDGSEGEVELFGNDLRQRRADAGAEIDMAAKSDDAALGGETDIYVERLFV